MTFFNIFSSQSDQTEEEKITVIADHREKNALVIAELTKRKVKVILEHLAVADYLVNEVAIERKTISDLKSSIINKRLLSQLPELKQYPKHLLLIEGIQEEDLYSGIIHENAFRGFLLTVALSYHIPLLFTQSPEDTAKYLIVLGKKQGKGDISFRPSKIAQTDEEKIQFILEGFPYVGPTKAKKLMHTFHSLQNIINASQEELQKVLGIRAKEVKKLMAYHTTKDPSLSKE